MVHVSRLAALDRTLLLAEMGLQKFERVVGVLGVRRLVCVVRMLLVAAVVRAH